MLYSFIAPITKLIGGVLNKKQNLSQAATRLFVDQGFDCNTTLHIMKTPARRLIKILQRKLELTVMHLMLLLPQNSLNRLFDNKSKSFGVKFNYESNNKNRVLTRTGLKY